METLIETEVGAIKVETHPEIGPVIHIDIYKWTPSAKRAAMETFKSFLKRCDEIALKSLFAAVEDTNVKLQKFALLFGFRPTEAMLVREGAVYRVWAISTEKKDGNSSR